MAKNKVRKNPPQPRAEKTAKKNAAQRLDDMEQGLQGIINMLTDTVKQVNEALTKVKQDVAHDINVLAQEIDSLTGMVKAQAQRSQIAAQLAGLEDQVNEAMLKNSIADLKSKVDELVNAGVLKLDNTAPITDKTFVVGREVDADGNETNPRLQFAVASIDKALQDKLLNKKVGDLVEFEEGKPKFEPVEVFVIQEIKKEMNMEDEDSALEENNQEPSQDVENSTESGSEG